MNQTYTQWIIGAVIVVILAVAAFFFWKHSTPPVSVSSIGTSATSTSTFVASSTNPGYTIEAIPTVDITPPDFRTPLSCAANESAAVCTQLKAEAATYSAKIASNTLDLVAWINLGTVRKIDGDYTGAQAAWEYVARLSPSNSAAFSNLADLDMNFLHDYAKAESNYLIAIKNAPTDTSLYKDLFTLYTTTSYKPSATAAENILKKGIAANPTAVDLQVTLARYYKSQSRAADAKTEYDAAIANAKSQNQTDLAAQLTAEENQ